MSMKTCPKCGRKFSQMYSRTFACGDCPSASLGDCGMVKCPYCGHEFSAGGYYRPPPLI
ncbi:MAG: hypothetical protein EU536_02335 [Promethearchaeota archaeon]|nr:MAG: hypothetical protein EU536_02335 [Candidatus Lokiarchaeota archaeon]